MKLTTTKLSILLIIILNILSLAALYSSLHQGGQLEDTVTFHRQFIWITISWLFLIIFSCINYRIFYDFGFILYGLNILLLVGVHLFGKQVMGAQRWIEIMGFTFQPSELSKLTTIIILAHFFSIKRENRTYKRFFLPLVLVLFNFLLIFKQPDLGTGLILIIFFFILGLSSTIKKKYFITTFIIGMLLCPFAWHILKDYQKQRLTVFLNPNTDPLGAGYTIIQSKIAIGSGKIFGKGFLSGTQNQFNFLPERHTDFIFTVIAEEGGLIGSIFLLLIYFLLIQIILNKARKLTENFARLICIGIATFFFFHVFINISMTLGILPVVGLPLAFLSYGGSNLLICFILMGIFFNIIKNNEL